MPDNVTIANAPIVVATLGDAQNVQHQEVVNEFLSGGGAPLNVATNSPLPTADDSLRELLTAVLVELRIANELQFSLAYPEVEELALLRMKYLDWPATIR